LNHLAVGVTQVGVQLTIISICHSVHHAGNALTVTAPVCQFTLNTAHTALQVVPLQLFNKPLAVSYHTVHCTLGGSVAEIFTSFTVTVPALPFTVITPVFDIWLLLIDIQVLGVSVFCLELIALVITAFCTGFNDVVSNLSSIA
jgi:hypothetical protein